MILQIPVQGGHKGGTIVLEHGGQTKQFPFDIGSGEKFSLVAFYDDCEHQLEQVTEGWRLTLVFNLVWKDGVVPAIKAPIDIPIVLEIIKEIKEEIESSNLKISLLANSDGLFRQHNLKDSIDGFDIIIIIQIH
jgi:hypothetical protein